MTNLLYVLTLFSYLVPIWVLIQSATIATRLSKTGAPNSLSYITAGSMILYIGINTAYLVGGQLTGNTISIYYRMMHIILFLLPLALQRLVLLMAAYVDWETFHTNESMKIHAPIHTKKGA
jgi:hypothetical protein